jgi:structural maintenance of chromosome 4
VLHNASASHPRQGRPTDISQVSIVASYIKERTKNAQFIVISLRNNMFELAERLVGIYKVNHMTKSVTVENRDYLSR